ncbi:helix-turn-helix transcriptional regulator [Vibrio alginolyticus]
MSIEITKLLYTLDEAAEALSLSRATLNRLREEGKFPQGKYPTGKKKILRWKIQDLIAWIDDLPSEELKETKSGGEYDPFDC